MKVPAFAKYLKSQHGESWKKVVRNTANMMLELGDNPILNEKEIKEIQGQVLVLKGDQDNMVSKEESKNVTDALLHGQFKELKNTVHPLEKVDPNVVTNEILEFDKP